MECKQQPVFFGSALNNFGVKELWIVLFQLLPHQQKNKVI